MLAAGKMPDERRLWQIHEEVEMVAELLEEVLLQIFLQWASQQVAHLAELCRAISTLHKLTFNADSKTLFAHLVTKRNNTVIVL